MQFLVIMRMRDPSDTATQERREKARADHLAGASKLREQRHLLAGGAIFDSENRAAGSAAIASFDTREELDNWLRNDPYRLADVWQEIEVIPFTVSPHYNLG